MCALSSSRFLCSRWGLVLRSSGAVFLSLSKINILQTKRSACFHEIRTAPGRSSRVDVPVLSNNMSSNTSDAMSQRMVWVDLEMTGLDIEKDKIIEMACIITDSELNVLAEGPNLIINQPTELLDGMSDWCKEHHGKSGLTQSVKDSKISLQQAEYEFLSFIRQHTQPGQCPLAGNSVHADKKFLDKYMPQFMYHLHYRIIDVSTIKELCRRWFPEEYKLAPQKKASHRALGDIQESIRELQFYRAHVFRSPAEQKNLKVTQNGDGDKTAHN
ncbi:unnamed protein product [Gadus morhua 'NCC']